MAPVKPSPPLATGLRLQPNSAFWSAPPRLVHLKSLSAMIRSDQRTCPVSSENYLAASLSLSPESEEALSIAKFKPYIIKSTANADSVVALFRDYGFSRTQIARVFSLLPALLECNPRFLKPKLDFFFGCGISGDAVKEIIAANPAILTRSLQKLIIPCLNFLGTFFAGDHHAVASFLLHKRPTWIFYYYKETATPANVETLRRHGVPEAHILKLARLSETLGSDPERFSDVAGEIKKMGFDPQSFNFIRAFRVLVGMTKEKWESKMELLKKLFGWSDGGQAQALFLKQTRLMSLSEEKLIRGFEVFVNRLGWTPDEIAKYPTLLSCSLEERILPRFAVLEILLSRGVVKRTVMGNAFLVSEAKFLARFVEIHQKELPQLMEIYTNNKGLKIDI